MPIPKRSDTARVQLPVRMRENLRARLEKAAKASDVSLNAEVVERLERSFAEEDAFGGPEIANMARLMAAAFLLGGQRGAHRRKHPEWTPSEWINEPFCYEAAVAAVVDALEAAQPVPYESNHPDPGQRKLHANAHKFFARMAARGAAVYHIEAGEGEEPENG